jgi:hypothetical protein
LKDGRVLVLLGTPACHLCHEMRDLLKRVLPQGVSLLEKDIRTDPDLERRYLLEIPVLLFGDEEVARHRVSEEELRARLSRLGLD